VNVTFYGVRGSTPCPAEGNRRYGGNTSCVALESPGHDPIVLDLGTGLRMFGETLPHDGSFHGHALVTHVHWDHVQGLPFFMPVLKPGASFEVYGPPLPDQTLADCFGYRNQIGMDVVLEALRLWRERRRKKLDVLLKYARMRRVERAMRPYLEA